ncbi:hypothetical protein B0H10DRAFT_2051329, partial [Mycena sp. CBHHK59/15]
MLGKPKKSAFGIWLRMSWYRGFMFAAPCRASIIPDHWAIAMQQFSLVFAIGHQHVNEQASWVMRTATHARDIQPAQVHRSMVATALLVVVINTGWFMI